MNAHRIKTTVDSQGRLLLDALPFKPGQPVEIIILERSPSGVPQTKDRYPLRGKVLEYQAPCDPVAEDDWEANQ